MSSVVESTSRNPFINPSAIVDFYKGSTIFLTGGTGFLGRIFIEKLLRSCPDLKKLYLVVRPKKSEDAQTRFRNIFEGPIFDQLRLIDPDFTQKVTLIAGDCSESNLGLNEDDRSKLIEEVDCIIHSAATVRFDEKLKIAININVRATRDLIEIAKKMTKLRAMVHISTAFSHCTRSRIDEVIYDIPISGKDLIRLAQILNEDQLEEVAPTVLGKCPNSYILTKSAAEDIIKTDGKDLPIAIVRPSIISGSVREPIAGWVEGIYGNAGVKILCSIGLLRCLRGDPKGAADTVPADYTVNCVLAAAWDVINKKNRVNGNDDIPVYNFVSGPESKVTWREYVDRTYRYSYEIPTCHTFWYATHIPVQKSKILHAMLVMISQIIPAYIIDFVSLCLGKTPKLVKGMEKIEKMCKITEYFRLNEWVFKNNNVLNLWNDMSKKDKAIFEFSMANFNWDDYFRTYIRGIRVYLMKDPLDTVPQGKSRFFKLKIAHYTLVTALTLMFFLILRYIINLMI